MFGFFSDQTSHLNLGYDANVTLLIEYRCDVIIYIAAVNYVCNV